MGRVVAVTGSGGRSRCVVTLGSADDRLVSSPSRDVDTSKSLELAQRMLLSQMSCHLGSFGDLDAKLTLFLPSLAYQHIHGVEQRCL